MWGLSHCVCAKHLKSQDDLVVQVKVESLKISAGKEAGDFLKETSSPDVAELGCKCLEAHALQLSTVHILEGIIASHKPHFYFWRVDFRTSCEFWNLRF